ncbi:MAG: response regulator [Synergistaceae bacterium]|jgi:two-component system response regulator YesN|nr:response regulator [Synergistaceae bacterium]
MYNVLIVDDEPIIRAGMCKFIDWEKAGFKIVGTAENGHSALRQYRRTPADLVVTDISMPRMDGLDLIRQIKNENGLTVFIIISGYDQFEYARQGIKLAVTDYLLKPIDEDELLKTLSAIKRRLDEQRNVEKPRADFFQDLLSGNIHPALRQMLLFMEKNLCGQISLNALSQLFKISPCYISQLFKKELGVNFLDLVMRMRVEKSKVLLSDMTLRISDIAYMTGFSDVHYFSRVFKRATNLTPSEYRKEL